MEPEPQEHLPRMRSSHSQLALQAGRFSPEVALQAGEITALKQEAQLVGVHANISSRVASTRCLGAATAEETCLRQGMLYEQLTVYAYRRKASQAV